MKTMPKSGQFAITWRVNGDIWADTFKWKKDGKLYKLLRGYWHNLHDPEGYFEQLVGTDLKFMK
jgi:hypothetical protein